jgi:undecaprenyl phosphate N,N'-diacetylbacillosamine 1-phosphate transferase
MMTTDNNFYCIYIKRGLDIFISLFAIIAFCWLYVILAILVWIMIGRPIIFKQQRVGKDGKVFTLYKFRTMTDERNSDGNLLPDDIRLTKFGKLLRLTSLDELPEMWNILKGDMSVVGPRPLLISYLNRYNSNQMRRHEVRPGLTGWAQVNGRNTISWEEKFDLDVWYVDHISFWLDLKIVALTVLKVIRCEGINSEDATTMKEFKGSH